MKDKIIISIIGVSTLISLISCYKLENEIFVDIEPPRQIIQLNTNVDDDTVNIYDLTLIAYSLDVKNESIKDVMVTIDNQYIYSTFYNDFVSFEVEPLDYGSGVYDLDIEIYLKSGTKSLADVTDSELVRISDQKKIKIDIDPPKNSIHAEFHIVDGKSIISWNRPDKLNLLSNYIIIMDVNSPSVDTVKIDSNNAVEYHDSKYAGGEKIYKVGWKGYDYYIESEPVYVNEKIIEDFIFTINSSGRIEISAPDFRLYNNDIEMHISAYPFLETEIKVDKNLFLIDTKPIYFGEVREYSVILNFTNFRDSVYDMRSLYEYTSKFEAYLNKRIKNFNEAYYFESNGLIILIKQDNSLTYTPGVTIYKYESENMQLLDSIKINTLQTQLICSPDGSHIYYVDIDKYLLMELDITTMSNYDYISLSKIDKIFDCYGCSANIVGEVSNNNILTIANYSINKNAVYDLSSNSLLFTREEGEAPIISPDGELIYLKETDSISGKRIGNIYKKDLNNYNYFDQISNPTDLGRTTLIKYQGTYQLIGFNIEDIQYGYDKHYFWNISIDQNTGVLGGISMYVNTGWNTHFDVSSHTLYGNEYSSASFYNNSTQFKVYNAQNTLLVKEHPVVYKEYRYFDGKLLSKSGLYKEL